jgi:hypothetical protein
MPFWENPRRSVRSDLADSASHSLAHSVRFSFRITLCFFLGAASVLAVSKPHVTTFGKWTAVKSFADLDQNRSDHLKVRAVHVDGRLKKFTFGIPHEVTKQRFVARRVVRVNVTLPQESAATPHWSWQRGGGLVVNPSPDTSRKPACLSLIRTRPQAPGTATTSPIVESRTMAASSLPSWCNLDAASPS